MKNFATFDAAFPTHPETNDEGDVVRAGGYELALAITDFLGAILQEVSGPIEHSWYGWQITASDGSRDYWFMLQFPDRWLLMAEDRTGLLRRFRSSTRLPTILDQLARDFADDRRFSNVSWMTREAYERASAEG